MSGIQLAFPSLSTSERKERVRVRVKVSESVRESVSRAIMQQSVSGSQSTMRTYHDMQNNADDLTFPCCQSEYL